MQPVVHVAEQAEYLKARRCGRIVVERGRLDAVYGRWWPHETSLLEVYWDRWRRNYTSDRCELFYHAPWGSSRYLTLSYVRSGPETSLSTFYAATLVLDEIARLKDSNAIVCNVTNVRISDRLMTRWGWVTHCESWKGRHFIKRLYGKHPEIPGVWRERLKLGSTA
ncbi:MAG: hypothetical protein AAF483_02735 [Planctomycetota bacterium]